MADLVFVAAAVAFFALAALYVTACERLLGREQLGDAPGAEVERDADPVVR